jgi:hypothetical protein
VFRNKTRGIALIDLSTFGGHTGGYLHSVRRSGHAGPQSRKATARGYRLRRIDRNDHVDEIHAIHTSCEQRQGRPMGLSYRIRKRAYADPPISNARACSTPGAAWPPIAAWRATAISRPPTS